MSKKMPPAMKWLLLPFYGNYLKMRYGLKTKGFEEVLPFDGPAVVFSNHTHIDDPFLISARYPYHIRWVAGSHLWRLPLVGWLLTHWVSAIPKTQGRSDLETIRAVSNALKDGDIVGLFPEGTRTWDGDITDIVKGTAKLVRIFRVPVVFINIENGFARKPRWSESDTKCGIGLSVAKVLTADEIRGMSLQEITDVVEDALGFSHAAWIKDHPEACGRSKGIAEGAERLFYACPKCHGIGTIHTHGQSVDCTCGAHAEMKADYTLEGNFGFSDLPSWHRWERTFLGELLETPSDRPVFPWDECCLFEKTVGRKTVPFSTDLTVTCFSDRLSFRFRKGGFEGMDRKDFPFDDLESLIITAKQTVEFYVSGQQYRFRPSGRESMLKYQELFLEWQARKED